MGLEGPIRLRYLMGLAGSGWRGESPSLLLPTPLLKQPLSAGGTAGDKAAGLDMVMCTAVDVLVCACVCMCACMLV